MTKRPCFNSTLVQLKDLCVSKFRRLNPGFNSTLVQLKGDGNNWRSVILDEFQFYLSSIKRFSTLIDATFSNSFNSTLVQLKVNNPFGCICQYLCFNSTLVQLKDTSQPSDASAKSSFNSTLVQLKATY